MPILKERDGSGVEGNAGVVFQNCAQLRVMSVRVLAVDRDLLELDRSLKKRKERTLAASEMNLKREFVFEIVLYLVRDGLRYSRNRCSFNIDRRWTGHDSYFIGN